MIKKVCTKARTALFLCLLVLAICLPVGNAGAQDLITTMTEQLAKLELYLKEVKEGYSIVQKGLTTIGNIKKGDFDLHSLFFNSLKDVNPAIKNWGKVADIIAMQVQLLVGCKTSIQQATASGNFSSTDLKYLAAVYTNLTNLTGKDIDELTGLVSDGNWQMTDDDRMSRIDQLFNQVSEKYNFLRSLSSRIMTESAIRTQQKSNIQKLHQLIIP
jgi:archaellum component FlaC